eukprot:5374357-Amphidinium_carterae.2
MSAMPTRWVKAVSTPRQRNDLLVPALTIVAKEIAYGTVSFLHVLMKQRRIAPTTAKGVVRVGWLSA